MKFSTRHFVALAFGLATCVVSGSSSPPARAGQLSLIAAEIPMENIQMITSPLPLVFVVAAIAVLGVTGNLFASSPFVITAQVAAVVLNLWARISFQRGSFRVTAAPSGAPIITHGPYRFIRHPMYSAALVFIWAGVASHLSVLTLAIAIAVTAVVIARVIVEERLLRAKYPEYPDYSRSTKALIPFVL